MWKRWMAAVAVGLLLCGCMAEETRPEEAHPPKDQPLAPIQLVFFGDEAEDALLLYGDGFSVLVDAGLNKTGKEIVEGLHSRGIQRLDLLLITHFDKDHVGGGDKVLEAVPVERVLAADYEGDAKQYTQFLEVAAEAGVVIERVQENMTLQLGGMALEIDVADRLYGQENDRSLVTTVRYGACSLYLTGDAENDRLAELLAQGVEPCTLLKVPHHGRVENLSASFFAQAAPDYALITSSAKEPEDAFVVETLQQVGAEVFLTRLGPVEGQCDGCSLRLWQSRY